MLGPRPGIRGLDNRWMDNIHKKQKEEKMEKEEGGGLIMVLNVMKQTSCKMGGSEEVGSSDSAQLFSQNVTRC